MNGVIAPGTGAHVGQHVGRRCVLGACLEDTPDDLDERPFRLTFGSEYLPPGVDLRRWMTPVEDAGMLGSASAAALAGAVEYLAYRATQRHADVSRLFIYYHQRLLRNQVRQDAGGSLRDGVRVLTRLGVPLEVAWPYSMDLFAVQPPATVYRVAARHRIVDYARVPLELSAMRGCLAGGHPIALGLYVWARFLDVGSDGKIVRPAPGERPEGRHALLLVGYSEPHRCFIARNTWGASWGDGGYCYVPYEYVLDPTLAAPGWVLRTSQDLGYDVTAHVAPGLMRSSAELGGGGTNLSGTVPATATPTAGSLFGPAGTGVPHGFRTTTPVPHGALSPAAAAGVAAGAGPLATGPAAALAKPPSFLGALGAIALGRKSPMELAVELASHHSGGLVARFTGSQMAGQLVGGVVRQLAPAVRSGSPLTVGTVGGAFMQAATGAAPGPSAPQGAPAASHVAVPGTDPGVLLDADHTATVLATLRTAPAASDAQRHHWDDSYDEEAAVLANIPAGARPAAPVAPAGAAPPQAAPPHPAPPQQAAPRTAQHAGAARPAGVVVPRAPAAGAAAAGAGARPAPARARHLGTQLIAMVPEPAAIAAGATGAAGAAGAAGATGTAPATPADALLAAWRAAGGAESELGRVTSGELSLSDGVGRGLVCKEGAVLWHPARGAFALAGSLFHTWTRMGAEGGPLGYPVTPEHRVTEGAWSARLVRFERGLIVDWMHAGAEDLPPFAILDGDALYQTWLSAGAEQGPAGVPVGVPQELSNTTIRLLPCSDGAVVWMAGRGTAVLDREQYQTWCASLGRG